MSDRLRGAEFKLVAFRELARVGKALSDPRRLELLELLCQSEKSVHHVARQLGVSIATVSHHLQVLKRSHLARERRAGRFVFYEASPVGQAAWTFLVGVGETNSAEVRSAVAEFFERDWTYEPVGVNHLRGKVERGEILLLDVRPAEEFLAGHFPGAVSLPLRDLQEKLRTIPRDAEVVAYCRGPYCVLAHDAVAILRRGGIRAYHWRQGVLDWKRLAARAPRGNPPTRRASAKGASK